MILNEGLNKCYCKIWNVVNIMNMPNYSKIEYEKLKNGKDYFYLELDVYIDNSYNPIDKVNIINPNKIPKWAENSIKMFSSKIHYDNMNGNLKIDKYGNLYYEIFWDKKYKTSYRKFIKLFNDIVSIKGVN